MNHVKILAEPRAWSRQGANGQQGPACLSAPSGNTEGTAAEGVEDEYSYPPQPEVIELEPLGVQVEAPSKRRVPTRKLHAAVLDDAAIARCRAKGKVRP